MTVKKFIEFIKSLSAEQRIRMAFEMYDEAVKITQDCLREKHPLTTFNEASRELQKLLAYASGKAPVARP